MTMNIKTNDISISIIVPMYNISKWIEDCINSMKRISKRKDIEIMIINDGSTDDSLTVAKKAIKGTDIKILTKKNGGLASARNFGAEKSSGKYLWFVDGDDMIVDDKIDQLIKLAEKQKYDVIHFKIDKIDDQTKKIAPDFGWKNKNNISEEETQTFIKKNGFEFSPWSKIYKRELFIKDSWPSVIYEDVFFVTKLLIDETVKIYFFNHIFYRYRVNRIGSILNCANDKEKNRVQLEKISKFFKSYEKDEPYFISGMYLSTAKLHVLNKKDFATYKKNLKYVIKNKNFKNYFKRSLVYKIAWFVLYFRLFFILKFVLKNKKVAQ